MRFEVGVVEHFQAAHHLQGDFGPASRTHGHTYRVEATVDGAGLRPDGTLLDLGQLQAALRSCLASLDWQDLDHLPAFAHRNSTAEVVAEHIAIALEPALTGLGLETLSVRVWESPFAFGGCQITLA